MSKITDTFRNIFKIHELRQRIFYTLALLFLVRLGAHITIPGIDTTLLTESMRNTTSDNLFGLYDLFVGGAFSNAAIFALGIMPYISASIIIQLMGAVVPYIQKLQQEGEEGGVQTGRRSDRRASHRRQAGCHPDDPRRPIDPLS